MGRKVLFGSQVALATLVVAVLAVLLGEMTLLATLVFLSSLAALVCFWPWRIGERSAIGRSVLSGLLIFGAFACAAGYAIELIVWLFFVGDNDSWFYHHVRLVSLLSAAGMTGVFGTRVGLRRASRRYQRTCAVAAWLIVAFWSSALSAEYIRQIHGLTALEAAESIGQADWRFVEFGRGALPQGRDYVQYLAYEDARPRFYVMVVKNPWLGWSRGSSMRLEDPEQVLSRAKAAAEYGNRESAILIAKNLVDYYPGTPERKEALRLIPQWKQELRQLRANSIGGEHW